MFKLSGRFVRTYLYHFMFSDKGNEEVVAEGKSMKGQARTSIKTGRNIDEGDGRCICVWAVGLMGSWC